MIPTVPGSEIDVNTVGPGAKLDPGAMTAPARAAMDAVGTRYRSQKAIAGGLEDLGGAFEGLAGDMMKVRRAKVAADADVSMRAAQQSFLESIRGDQNEADWGNRAREVYETTRDKVLSSGQIPPNMRGELDSSLKSWGQSLQIHAQTMAAVQTVNRAEVSIKKSYEEAGRDGDAQGMLNAVRLGRSSKLDPVAMDEMEANIPKNLALTAIEQGLRNNPQGTHDLLVAGEALPIADAKGQPIIPSKVFAQKEYQALVNAARTQAAAWQRSNFEGMLQESTDSITGFVPESVIRDKIASKEISAKAGQALIDAQDRKLKAQTAEESREALRVDRDAYNVLESKVHDPLAWGDKPDEYANELIADAAGISNPALRHRAINDANKQLLAVKKKGQLDVKPIESQVMALMRADMELNGAMLPVQPVEVAGEPARKGFLGIGRKDPSLASTKYLAVAGGLSAVRKMDDAAIKDAFGLDATKDQVIQEIQVHHARLENQMREWFKTEEGQKATFEQANAHRMEIERPYVMDAVKATLAKRAPVQITSKKEFDDLPAGAPFVWNGRLGYKN